MTWEKAEEFHRSEGRKILDLAEGLSTEHMQTRVLVPPIRGIEDSSRFWSVAMTMEHLIIVGDQMRGAITSLCNGKVPQGKADIAAVKPKGAHADRSVIPQYQSFLMRYRTMYDRELRDRNSQVTFAHPWFGEMTAFRWHCLAASHTYLHRKQIQAIIEAVISMSRKVSTAR